MNPRRARFVAASLILTVAAAANAQSGGSDKKGSAAKVGSGARAAGPVGVGDQAPGVTLPSLAGTETDLGQTFADGKTVLVVLRGFPGYQCPLCSRQVGEYISAAGRFAAAGVDVVLVYPGPGSQLGAKAEEFLGDRTLPSPLTMVLDPDYAFTDAYGLRWDAPNETAYPSTFVVAPGGSIEWARVSKTHGGRVAATEALAAAIAAGSGSGSANR